MVRRRLAARAAEAAAAAQREQKLSDLILQAAPFSVADRDPSRLTGETRSMRARREVVEVRACALSSKRSDRCDALFVCEFAWTRAEKKV
jgi:hypothetical protein